MSPYVWLSHHFALAQHGTTLRTELLAGVTTFLTMAYIVFVQPVVLGAAGMDPGAVMVATCLGSAIACVLMAFLANYPVALAPGMGHNFYFTYSVVVAMQVPWETALGAVAIGGVLMLLAVNLREELMVAIPPSLKHAIAVGIGLLIALVGLRWAGLIVAAPGTLVGLGDLTSLPVLLALFGLVAMAALLALGSRGAMLLGILLTTAAGLLLGLVQYSGVIGAPPSLAPTLLQLDLLAALQPEMFAVIFVFFFLDLFDTVGTLIGVSEQAGLASPDGRLPRARQALTADALATVGGAVLGTSTITSYVESATGIAAGGRTGVTTLVAGALFVLAIFFAPLVRMIGGGVRVADDVVLYPIVAPALILVGAMMMKSSRAIAWDDGTESIPAFLTLIVMPLTLSITEGLSFGFIAYALLKLLTGRAREAHPFIYVFAGLFVIRYVFLV